MAMQGDICFFAGDSKTCSCRGAKVVTSHFLQHLLILFSWAGVYFLKTGWGLLKKTLLQHSKVNRAFENNNN